MYNIKLQEKGIKTGKMGIDKADPIHQPMAGPPSPLRREGKNGSKNVNEYLRWQVVKDKKLVTKKDDYIILPVA